MKRFSRRVSRRTAALLAVLVVGVVSGLLGCSEAVVRQEEAGPVSKLRHAHLLPRALQGGGMTDAAAGALLDGATVGLLIGLDAANPALEPQAVVHRYREVHGYEVVARFAYRHTFNGLAVEVPAAQLEALLAALAQDPDVAWVEPNLSIQPEGRTAGLQAGEAQLVPWSLYGIGGAGRAAAGEASGLAVAGVDLFVIDTGVSSDDVNVVSRYDVWAGTQGDAADDVGHGTHVAGLAAAVDDGDGIVGLAPGAAVHSLKVTNAWGETDVATVIQAVERVTAYKRAHPERPVVANISLGADIGTTAYNALDEAVAASIAQGVIVVVAAGNDGIDAATVTPAHVREAITVGAYDIFNLFAPFSNHGTVVDLLAPGVDIPSLALEEEGAGLVAFRSGTSMAAGHVSGAVVRYLAQAPTATPAQVRAALVDAGTDRIAGAPAGTTRRTVKVAGY